MIIVGEHVCYELFASVCVRAGCDFSWLIYCAHTLSFVWCADNVESKTTYTVQTQY